MKLIFSLVLIFGYFVTSAGVPAVFHYCGTEVKQIKGNAKTEKKVTTCEKSSGCKEESKIAKADENDASNSFIKYIRNHISEFNNLKCDSFRFKEQFFPINNTLLSLPLPLHLYLGIQLN